MFVWKLREPGVVKRLREFHILLSYEICLPFLSVSLYWSDFC